MHMKAVIADRPGEPREVLTVRWLPEPAGAGAPELLIRMTASTCNPSDVVTVSGAYMSRTTYPFVPGFEGVGVVESAGSDVPAPHNLVGRRVLPLGGPGCWQQLRSIDHTWCVPVPDELDDVTACFSYINPLTASFMVSRYCRGARSVVVTAAASAIGGHLAELLTEICGVRPIGLVRTAKGRAAADPDRWAGVVTTDDPDWAGHVRKLTPHGRGPDVILDCIGGRIGDDFVDLLTPGGTLVLYGLLSGIPLPAGCFDGRRGTSVEFFRLRDVVHSHPRDGLCALFAPIFSLQQRGLLLTPVSARAGLDQFLTMLAGGTSESGPGKVLIDPWM